MTPPVAAPPSPLRVLLIGLGGQGREHYELCRRRPDLVRLAALCDPRVKDLRASLDPPDGCALLEEFEPADAEAAIVAVPPSEYRALLPRLLDAGLHVLVEKPLGVCLRDAFFFVEMARKGGLTLAPAVQRRFHPSYLELARHFSAANAPAEALLAMRLAKTPDGWRRRERVGVLFDLGFHALDLARGLFGDLHLLSATLTDEHGRACHDGFDHAADLVLRTEAGTFLRCIVARCCEKKEEFLEARFPDGSTLRASRGELSLRPARGPRSDLPVPTDWNAAMEGQLAAFVAACRGASPNLADMYGLATMNLLEQAYGISNTL